MISFPEKVWRCRFIHTMSDEQKATFAIPLEDKDHYETLESERRVVTLKDYVTNSRYYGRVIWVTEMVHEGYDYWGEPQSRHDGLIVLQVCDKAEFIAQEEAEQQAKEETKRLRMQSM